MTTSTDHGGTDDEKLQTFRKRRLSLTKHHITLEPVGECDSEDSSVPTPAMAQAAGIIHSVASKSDQSLKVGGTEEIEEATPGSGVPDASSPTPLLPPEKKDNPLTQDDDKAHTFRKRRLSLTHRTDDEESKGDSASSIHKAKRRLSELSSASISSIASWNGGVLRSRTVHAGELISHGQNYSPPSPAIDTANQHVLYRTPRPIPLPLSQPSSAQPKWKKRHTRHLHEDERKLPFPRDIVGTFSCHGVEPIYDSDYDQDSEEEWEEDITGSILGSTAPNNFKLTASEDCPQDEKESKPTTVAKINQDRGGVAFPYGNCPRTALFAAYDGHGQGGELVSQFALHEIQSRLEKCPEFSTNLEKAFKDTFLAVDEALKHEPLIEPLYAGTTACVALLRERTLTLANAGDSRAVIARRNGSGWNAIDLTEDQNPDMPEERKRIESMGGFVSPPPEPGLSARVWLDAGFTQIGLAMSRSIGDHAVARVGVIAEPVVTHHKLSEDDDFMVIASDGVWEFLSSSDVVKIVADNLNRGATKACQALIEASASMWHHEEGDYRDDITALVVRLNELWPKNK